MILLFILKLTSLISKSGAKIVSFSYSLMCGMAYMQYSFAVGTPINYRCLIPECETAGEAKYEAPWKDKFIPVEGSLIFYINYPDR